jgi:hypothetical protein
LFNKAPFHFVSQRPRRVLKRNIGTIILVNIVFGFMAPISNCFRVNLCRTYRSQLCVYLTQVIQKLGM